MRDQTSADQSRPHDRPAVRGLSESIRGESRTHHLGAVPLPSRPAVIESLHDLFALMYPGFYGPRDLSNDQLDEWIDRTVARIDVVLFEQTRLAMRYTRSREPNRPILNRQGDASDAAARKALDEFFHRLPEVRRLLALDVQAAYDGDPAARHTDEVIFSYPGIIALTTHRLAHELDRLGVPMIPRMMAEYAHGKTGIDIHPGATIGESFFIDHGTGVVIGETTIIGDHCRIYQGVTLGTKSFPKDGRGRLVRGTKRHPTLGDYVTVYAGATILGGDTRIGDHCVVNGGVFLTQSVAAGHIVRQRQPELKLRSNPDRSAVTIEPRERHATVAVEADDATD